MYIDIMDMPSRYICRITRSKKFDVPDKCDNVGKHLLPLLCALISVKEIAVENMKILKQGQVNKDELKSSFKRSLFDQNEDEDIISKK
jgi:hypothetical protein